MSNNGGRAVFHLLMYSQSISKKQCNQNRNLLQDGQTDLLVTEKKKAIGKKDTFSMDQFQGTYRHRAQWSGHTRFSPMS